MTTGAQIGDTQVNRGDPINVNLAVLNRSSVQPDSVEVAVYEHVQWSATRHSDVSKRKVGMISINPENLPGASKLEETERKVAIASAMHTGVDPDTAEVFSLVCQSAPVQVSVDRSAHYSYASHGLVRVSHSIVIETRTGMCISNPLIETMIRVAPEVKVMVPEAGPAPTQVAESGMGQWNAKAPELFAGVSLATPVNVPTGQPAVYGGAVAASTGNDGDNDDMEAEELAASGKSFAVAAASAPPAPIAAFAADAPPTFEQLMKDMDLTLDDPKLLTERLESDTWRPLLESLTPEQFGAVINAVDFPFDQPRAAKMLADARGTEGYSCAHIAACIGSAKMETASKQNIVSDLLNGASDKATAAKVVYDLLDPYDRLVTSSAVQWDQLLASS